MSRQQDEAKAAMERCMLSGKEDVLAQDLAHGEKENWSWPCCWLSKQNCFC